MKTRILCLMFLVGLPACLKQNYPSGNNLSQSQKIQGAIVMRDWHGKALEKPEGHVLAQFLNPTKSQSVYHGGLRNPLRAGVKSTTSTATQCQVIQEPKINLVTGGFEGNKDVTVSMGKISFGVSENSLKSLTEGENHLYKLNLQPNFESGIYLASIEGNVKTPGFSLKMSMPERMDHVFVAGQDFETSATAFRKSEVLQLSWDAPKGDFDIKINQMELEIISETDKEVVSLVCDVMEKDLMTNASTVSWEIPTNYLQALDATSSGLVVLKRGQWMRASSEEIGTISFEGVRIFATQALIAE